MKFLQMIDGFLLAAQWHERVVGRFNLRSFPRRSRVVTTFATT